MTAVAGYIPSKEADLDSFLANFASMISATPMLYGLSAGDASTIQSAVDAWHTAYLPVTSPATRTAASVGTKNAAKVNVLGIVRPYAQTIALNPGVSSGAKIGLGLNPRTSTPSPVSPPASNPVLLVQSLANLSLVLRYRDSAASVSVKAKPFGVTRCRIYGMQSETPVTDPTLIGFLADATKSPAVLTFPGDAGGKQWYFAAQWVIRTGGVSPYSPIISVTVPKLA